MTVNRILFVHEKKATYPELAAYRDYFASRFETCEVRPDEANADPKLGQAICWHMMGLYPKRLAARWVIHDYRSLSVGRGRTLKDQIKRYVNHRPDLRIFQNDSIKKAMGFRDKVPEIFLPMGVNDDILDYRHLGESDMIGDFCYIGSMLPERRIDTMIASFLNRYGSYKTLWLYGIADAKLQNQFRANDNVIFPGMLPQKELFAKMRGFGAAVCYFPNHYPHVLQTPTKLLEYAALGLRIIGNEHPQSRIAARQYGINCLWGPSHDMFEAAPDTVDWPDNSTLDPTPMLWRTVIEGSNVDGNLRALVAR